ncbi:MAG: hypothetical protein J6O00_11200 [Clostridiales bacterium]|nr:hypothetical protein [Clostridiales bacterium]
MGVYSSNTYNPRGSIQAALYNVNERNRIKNEYWKRKGETWSDFAQDIGKIGTRMIDGLVAGSESNDQNSAEARLAALEEELKEAQEAERVKAIQDKYSEQVAQRRAMDDYLKNSPEPNANQYAEAMKGYRPNFGGYNYSQFQGGVYPEQEMQDSIVGGFNA